MTLANVKTCLYPKDPKQAVDMLALHKKSALILAGGTTSVRRVWATSQVHTLIDITRIGYDKIEFIDGEFVVGCNVRKRMVGIRVSVY